MGNLGVYASRKMTQKADLLLGILVCGLMKGIG